MKLASFDNRSFSRGASPLQEALWILCKNLFFLTNWPFPSSLRCWLLGCFGARIGDDVVVRNQVDISFPWRLEIGDHVWIGQGVKILSLASVTIRSNVCISQGAFLCTGSHDHRREDFALITAPILVESEVWIAASTFIAPGVTIGSNSVIGACSVILRDIPPGSFAAGNPARVSQRVQS